MKVEEAIELFRSDILARGTGETTWQTDYLKILKKFPDPNEHLTGEIMHEILLSTPPNTKTRRRAAMVLGRLSKFVGIDYDPTPYRGKYSPKRPTPREIPSDETIAEIWKNLSNPAYRWVWGMIAAYGVRPHEIAHVDRPSISRSSVLWILDGKTGARRVRPLHPEWFDKFKLYEPLLPDLNWKRPNDAIGHAIGRYFADLKQGIPALYNLRHAYAIRALRYGLPPKVTAKMMGHSPIVHQEIYQLWIDEDLIAGEYDRAVNREGRPIAP